jgi:dihydroorotase
MPVRISVPRVGDYHLHVRQGALLAKVAKYTARVCSRALLMPNTVPGDGLDGPIAAARDVEQYRGLVSGPLAPTRPLLTVKLLESTTPEVVRGAHRAGAVAAKLYPRGATTNAADGIPTDFLEVARYADLGSKGRLRSGDRNFLDCLGEMEALGMVLCCHGEMPNYPALPDRGPTLTSSLAFLDFLEVVLGMFPKLRVVLEHVTTREEVERVRRWHDEGGGRIAATITPHHLWMTLEQVVGRRLYPHNFCLPVAKFPGDREALVAAAVSGHPAFFLGSDSAPHPREAKECSQGCAGVYCAPVLVEAVVQVFAEQGALNRLPGFLAYHGDAFYRQERAEGELRLVREPWVVPLDCDGLRPFLAGERLEWSLEL